MLKVLVQTTFFVLFFQHVMSLKRHSMPRIIHGVEQTQYCSAKRKSLLMLLVFGRAVSKQYWCIQVYFRSLFVTPICRWLGNHILQQGSYGDWRSTHEWPFFPVPYWWYFWPEHVSWCSQSEYTSCGFLVEKIMLWKPITIPKNQRVEMQNSCWTIRPENNNSTLWRTILSSAVVELIYSCSYFYRKKHKHVLLYI